MRIEVLPLEGPSPAVLPLEIAERKGLGHPDTICDALAESVSVALSRFYLERFGAILHHNVDKALLWGGVARPAFGGGEVLEPIELYLAGRATAAVKDVLVPAQEPPSLPRRGPAHTHPHPDSPDIGRSFEPV
jgi:S-adenosylmethionine synthetase